MKFGSKKDFKEFSKLLVGLGLVPQFPLSLIDSAFSNHNYISFREAQMYPLTNEIGEVTKLEIYFVGVDEVFIWEK